jgi:hypothetical protein
MTASPDGTLTLATPALPPIPVVANYPETQALDPAQPFTLRWDSFADAGAQDLIWVRVESSGGIIFSTPIPGAPGALAGTATQVVIPAGTMSDGNDPYLAHIGFFKVSTQTAGTVPNSTARAGSYRQTSILLQLENGGGNGGDGGPVLLSTVPAPGTLNVATDIEVQFVFSRPMAPVTDLMWMADGTALSEEQFSYSWSADGLTLTAAYLPSWPAGSLISYALGEGFQDLAGVPLEGDNLGGFFLIGSGSGNGDCDDDPLEQQGSFSIFRGLLFQQTGATTVQPGSEGGAIFGATFSPPEGFAVSAASVTPPAAEAIPLQRFFGSTYFLFEAFPGADELNAAFPAGGYLAGVNPSTGDPIQMTLSVSGSFPPTPMLMNYDAGQVIDPDAPFTLTWNAFTGANASSFIQVDIYDPEGETLFSAPNECTGVALAPTATSVVVPAGTLQQGKVYELSLNFYQTVDTREHGAPELTFLAAHAVSTETTLRTIGGSVGESFQLRDASIGASGSFEGTVIGTAGAAFVLESSSDMATWETVTTLSIPPAGSIPFADPNPPVSPGQRFYRARGI